MKIKLTIIVSIILLLTIGLSGCEEEDKRFIGTWVPAQPEYPTFTFFKNKSYSIEGVNGMWEIKEGLLALTHGNGTEKYEFRFSQRNYQLTLTGLNEGIERAYYKVT
jgi:hypothetical protein